MAVTSVGAGADGGTGSTTSFSITLPTTVTGDIIILEYTHRGTTDGTIAGTYSGPAFSEVHDQQYASSTFSGKTLWSRATGNHSGQTVTGASLTNSCAAIVTVYRGALSSGTPIAGFLGEQNASGNETQAQISTVDDSAWVVLVVANSPDVAVTTQSTTSPGALTARREVLSTGGTDTSIAHASAEKTSAGATGAFTWAQTDGVSGSWAYYIIPEPPTYSQTSWRYYADGTESGSSALANQDTNYTADVSSGDVNLGLRVRLQNSNAIIGLSTDDYRLQYELNDSGTFTDVGSGVLGSVIDSYSESNAESGGELFLASDLYTRAGQAFTNSGAALLGAAKFHLSKNGTLSGDIVAVLYASSGTVGTNAVGTGAALATSNAVAASSITGTPTLYTFAFPTPYSLSASTDYVLIVQYSSTADPNYLIVGGDSTSPSHAGNTARFAGSWSSTTTDRVFYAYTASVVVLGFNSASLTDGNATTNRLGSGTGSFVAGKISEDGLVDNLEITASNYTELLYSLTIESTAVANNDTLDFRVLRNGATTGMTYTVTPRITVNTGGGGPANYGTFFGHM